MANLGEFGRELADLDSEASRDLLEPDTFLFHGEEFTLPVVMSALPLTRFAHAADKLESDGEELNRRRRKAIRDGVPQDEIDQMAARLAMKEQAAIYEFLSSTLAPGEWDRFERTAMIVGSDLDELLDVANRIVEAVSGRPTRRPAASPAGSSRTGGTSTDASVSLTPEPEPARESSVMVSGDTIKTVFSPAPEPEPALKLVTDEEVAAASGLTPREVQRRRWANEMVPVEEAAMQRPTGFRGADQFVDVVGSGS